MTPVFSLPMLPIQVAPLVASLPAQAVNFDALLSVSSGPVANTPDISVASVDPIGSPPVAQENQAAIMAVPEADIDADIRPLLAAFSSDPSPISISVLSPATASDKTSAPEIERDEAEPAQHECVEIVVPVPIVDPTPIPLPALVASTLAPAVLPSFPKITKADQPPKVTETKGGPPVMEPLVEIAAHIQAAPVQTISARKNIASALQQPTQAAPLPVNQAGATPIADLAALFASTPLESNSVFGAGFQTIMNERIAATAVRPLIDASALVADRALDVARGSLWLDQLAGDIAAAQDHDRALSFRMIPAQLGQLDVRIANREDGLQLNFSTQSEEAARIIGSAQSRLVEELKAQGVRVGGCEVNAGSGQSSFSQQNGQPVHPEIIAEFERPSPDFAEPTNPSQPQNGRFA